MEEGELALREVYMRGVRRGESRFVSGFESAIEFCLELNFADILVDHDFVVCCCSFCIGGAF